MERMLVTSDGSPESEAILPIAAELALSTGAEVHLLSVVHLPKGKATGRLPAMRPGSPGFRDPLTRATTYDAPARVVEGRDQAIERVEHEALHHLEQLSHAFREGKTHSHVRFNDDPAHVIVEMAKELRVDLIAMSTHGRGSLGSLVQGSVASKVIHAGVAPVLLARPSALR